MSTPEPAFSERMDPAVLFDEARFEHASSEALALGVDPEALAYECADPAEDDPWTRFIRDCFSR